MLVLTNCLTDRPDEGCVKVAANLIGRLKKAEPQITVAAYERQSELADLCLSLNKLLLSRKLAALLRRQDQPVLFVPFPAKELHTALRIWILSRLAPCGLRVLITMTGKYGKIARFLLKQSGAEILALSQKAADQYRSFLGHKRVTRLKTGVDTELFTPVPPEKKRTLKEKYSLDPEKKVLLHVGHMKSGRNVAVLKAIDPAIQVVLVTSTLTGSEADKTLRQGLLACPHIRLIEDYLPCIEDIYQLADVYLFPVWEEGNCIDVPLSVLEAAACGLPVVTTDYGELAQFRGCPGFWFWDNGKREDLNDLLYQALNTPTESSRAAVLAYDWRHTINYF